MHPSSHIPLRLANAILRFSHAECNMTLAEESIYTSQYIRLFILCSLFYANSMLLYCIVIHASYHDNGP